MGINEALESEINNEMAAIQNSGLDLIPLEEFKEAESNFVVQFKDYAENYLKAYNKYSKSKAETDELKSLSDAAEYAMINFAKDLGILATEVNLAFDGMASFKIKETYFGNIPKDNKAKVFAYFKNQKREGEFFELSVRKSEVNKFIRERINEAKVRQKQNKGGEALVIDLPDGITLGKKYGVSLSNRNSGFGI